MIELKNLTKTFKDKTAFENLSLVIRPGVVTGFLGPNGAGKSTTMKMILGLMKPTEGKVLIDGTKYQDLPNPIAKVGAFLDGNAINPKYTAKQHLEFIATASGLPMERVVNVLQQTGLDKVMDKQVGEFSLGMKQRLGIAAALIGDPESIILDEPFNGLDIDGIHWLRKLIKDLTAQGKAVLVSSHLMSEIQAIADRVTVLAQGKLVADMTIEEMMKKSLSHYVKVVCENNNKLKSLLEQNGAIVQSIGDTELHVHQFTMKQIGTIAKTNNLAIFELTMVEPTLEELFMELTTGKADYVAQNIDGM